MKVVLIICALMICEAISPNSTDVLVNSESFKWFFVVCFAIDTYGWLHDKSKASQ